MHSEIWAKKLANMKKEFMSKYDNMQICDYANGKNQIVVSGQYKAEILQSQNIWGIYLILEDYLILENSKLWIIEKHTFYERSLAALGEQYNPILKKI